MHFASVSVRQVQAVFHSMFLVKKNCSTEILQMFQQAQFKVNEPANFSWLCSGVAKPLALWNAPRTPCI